MEMQSRNTDGNGRDETSLELENTRQMRIATWNVNRGKREGKLPALEEFRADLSVIQEVAKPPAESVAEFWTGQKENQGLSVMAGPERSLHLDESWDSGLRYALPVVVAESFHLLGLWVMPESGYVSNLVILLTH